VRRLAVFVAVAEVAAVVAASGAPAARAAARVAPAVPVAVYPTPGDRYEQPNTQITFRGIPASEIGTVTVVGSKSGVHAGQIEPDSDGDGGSYISTSEYRAGETVTVTTGLDIVGGTDGVFHFTIETPGPALTPETLPVAGGPNSVQQFHSDPGLDPAAVEVTKDDEPAADGDIFVAPQFGPQQNGPMILDPSGQLVWFDPIPMSDNEIVTDFREQELFDQPVLTWFQGTTASGTGSGEGVIFNDRYEPVAIVRAGNGLHMDLHEFYVTNSGDAYIIAVAPVELPGVHRSVLNSVIQEIDIRTGLVLFQWDALDHLSPYDSYLYGPKESGRILDPFHTNSISFDAAGNPVVSMRNTDAIYDINRTTGQIQWELGGRHSTFKLGAGVATAFQHDAVVQSGGTEITVFDDGAGPPTVHSQSRAIEIALNTSTRTATLVRQATHSPSLSANFEGSVQTLAGGEWFVGWGQQPYFTEFNAKGQVDFDAHFATPTATYRAYRFPWSAQPPTAPALSVGTSASGAETLWESWNGATDVSGWRVLAGPATSSLTAIGSYAKHKFESTLVPGTGEPIVQVQALGASGQVLASTQTAGMPNHLQMFGSSAFVPGNGLTDVPVGCYSTAACNVSVTATSGGNVVAHSGGEPLAAGTGGLVWFRLSPGARAALSRNHRLTVSLSVKDGAGARSASASILLIAFSTSGSGPSRSFTQSAALQLVSGSDFVTPGGFGSTLAQCTASVPCRVTTTVTSGSTVIAATKPEYIGARQLGFLRFQLSAAGRALLARASGNQLPVTVAVSGQGITAGARSALVAFH
jgi:hypothetical protein